MSWTCGTCWREFAGWFSRDQHLAARGHYAPLHECRTSPRYFGSRNAVVQHMNTLNHWPFQCTLCSDTWPSLDQLEEHVLEYHRYCESCERQFCDANALRMHRNSSVHRGAHLPCPFCKAGYVSATGLSHHLESGSCPSADLLDRDRVYQLVRFHDSRGVLTKNLAGWSGSSAPRWKVTKQDWNGTGWECYICHRQFQSHHGLSQHVNSPFHKQALYHCPKRGACGKEFTSLAGVMNHLESESCGYTRFENVQATFQNLFRANIPVKF